MKFKKPKSEDVVEMDYEEEESYATKYLEMHTKIVQCYGDLHGVMNKWRKQES